MDRRRIGAEQAIATVTVIPGRDIGSAQRAARGLEPGIQRLLREIPGSHAQKRARPGMTASAVLLFMQTS
jgi:hypothetical protein